MSLEYSSVWLNAAKVLSGLNPSYIPSTDTATHLGCFRIYTVLFYSDVSLGSPGERTLLTHSHKH